MPGAAIGILRAGAATIAYHGVADVTTGEPVTPETRFSAGSLTKPMVATVIARLAEAGRLSLDDPVAAHVPELRGSDWAGPGIEPARELVPLNGFEGSTPAGALI